MDEEIWYIVHIHKNILPIIFLSVILRKKTKDWFSYTPPFCPKKGVWIIKTDLMIYHVNTEIIYLHPIFLADSLITNFSMFISLKKVISRKTHIKALKDLPMLRQTGIEAHRRNFIVLTYSQTIIFVVNFFNISNWIKPPSK